MHTVEPWLVFQVVLQALAYQCPLADVPMAGIVLV
jgi:hypothetical protein